MIKHKIIYVDEESKELRNFQRKFSPDFDVLGQLPTKTADELINIIFDNKVEALVTDFNLSEYRADVKYPVPYDGVGLVAKLLEVREGFPCFILTSFDADAIKESEDVNLIYPKDALHNKVGKTTLQEKVRFQIEHYAARMRNASTEFDALVSKASKGDITEKEEARLQELDSLLERSFNARNAIPKSAKQGTALKKLGELLQSTDKLLEEVRKGGNK